MKEEKEKTVCICMEQAKADKQDEWKKMKDEERKEGLMVEEQREEGDKERKRRNASGELPDRTHYCPSFLVTTVREWTQRVSLRLFLLDGVIGRSQAQ